MVHIGCSGWNYRHWRGLFYPQDLPIKRWFGFYAEKFDAVEINASFYRRPEASTFAAWAETAPPRFRYAVKVPRFITHMKKLANAEESIAEFLRRARHLGEALGPLLYQLPPHWKADRERLRDFLTLLPPDLAHVFEFRDPSWYEPAIIDTLDGAGASFCVHDFPGLATPRLAIGRIAYVRFHGTAGKYHGRYDDAELDEWARWLRQQEQAGRSAWAFFNNDIEAHAIADATALSRLTAT